MTTGTVDNRRTRLRSISVLRNRNFFLLWMAQLISSAASALTSLSASILVYRLTGSVLSVGLMLMATALPTVLVGLIAGVYIDRYDRKWIMITANLARVILAIIIPFLVQKNIAFLFIIVMLASVAEQFFDPAHLSVLPEVASQEELTAANSFLTISNVGTTSIGFAASGLIASLTDIKWAFFLSGASFLLSSICILLVRIKPLKAVERTNVALVWHNLKAGVRFLFDTPILRSLFTVAIPFMISSGLFTALLLPFTLRALKASEFVYGLQEGLITLGFVAGSLLMAGIFDNMREGPWIAIGYIGIGLQSILYSFNNSIPVATLLMVVYGLLGAPSSLARRLVMLRNTPREMRGRVISAFYVTRDLLFLIGMVAAGLADVIDIRIMYLISSLMALVGGFWALFLPGLRQEAFEWRHILHVLNSATTELNIGAGRVATRADIDALISVEPILSTLNAQEREDLAAATRVIEVEEGTAILRFGEVGDQAYFILAGRVVVGIVTAEGTHRSLSTLTVGDFFGEIAALTGARRTANVVADQATRLLQISAGTLRGLMSHPALKEIVLSKMNERLRANRIQVERPRFAGLDFRDLRTKKQKD